MKRVWFSALFIGFAASSSAQQAEPIPTETQPTETQTAGVVDPASLRLGRLFYTPAERVEVERARREPQSDGRGANLEPVMAPERPPSMIRFDGIADRSPRGPVIWINGRALEERSALYHHSLRIEHSQLVLTDRTGRQTRLSVGD